MARPQPHGYRRKRYREGSDGEEEIEEGQGYPKAQALPIADLPDDFDGVIEDGATYLAVAVRANASLPFVSRVPDPFRQPSPTPRSPGPGPEGGHDPTQSIASSSRHPALPKESWEILFPMHFTGYRKHLAELWPPSPALPYPSTYPKIPSATLRPDWYGYINGYTRKKVRKARPPPKEEVDEEEEEAMLNAAAPTSEERAVGTVEAIVDVDDEEGMLNTPLEDEVEQERHRPREPLVCILQSFTATEMTRILSHLAFFLDESIDNLTPTVYLPTQPSEPSTPSTSSPSPDSPPPNPFSARYARWIFALLCVLDPQLSGREVSTLRDLARAAMKVGAWRWIRAVTDGEITEDSPWVFGHRWKVDRDARPSGSGVGELDGDEEMGVDETLGRCWMVVHAVAVGWGQRDLVDELHKLFT